MNTPVNIVNPDTPATTELYAPGEFVKDAEAYGKRSRAWAFTVNNYSEDDKAMVLAIADEATYLIAGYEVGKKTGTPHLQGYVYFANARTYSSLRKKVPQGYFKKARGTGVQNQTYCKKGGNLFVEKGTPPIAGARTDLEEIYDMLREGATMRQVLDTEPNLQGIQVAEKFLKYNEAPRTAAAEIRWYYGPPGAGKSYAALKWLGEDVHVASRTTSKFWDGYDAHMGVLIDDFRPKWCDFVELLGILDEGPYAVEVKGSSRQFKATKIAITCPYTPEELYSNIGENLEQLTGRISAVVHVDGSVRSRPPPRRCTLGPDGQLVDIIDDKGKHATRSQEGHHQGPVQETAERGASATQGNNNNKRKNNLGVQLTPVNHASDVSICGLSACTGGQEQVSQDPQGQAYTSDQTDQEAVCFPQTPSLCSSGSDIADGECVTHSRAWAQDVNCVEDDDVDSCEP